MTRGPRPVAAAVACCALLSLTACESTQEKSARLAAEGAGRAEAGSLDLAAKRNPDVRAGTPVVLPGDGVSAVVVELENTGRAPQAGVPIALRALGTDGGPVFENDLDGLQVSLQQMAVLRPGEKSYWVNDQVVAPEPPAKAEVEVGLPAQPAGPDAAAKLPLEDVGLDEDETGAFLAGKVRNPTTTALKAVPVYAVGTKGGEVVAAGRGIVERVDPEPVAKPATFRIYFVGSPKGAELDVRAYPPPPVPSEEPTTP